MNNLLEISNYSLYSKENKILDNINLRIATGEIIAVVGESGSGKSMLAKSILNINGTNDFKKEGRILLEGKSIDSLPEGQMVHIRGKKIGMIFQEPLSYLNPTMRVGKQLVEPLVKHGNIDYKEATETLKGRLDRLKIKDLKEYLNKYPHELSGGMAQRGMIAMASSCVPRIIIADEPTSALDLITQESIAELLKNMSKEFGISVVFITHDLQLAGKIADRAVVISKGAVVEEGKTKDVFENPRSKAAVRLTTSVLRWVNTSYRKGRNDEAEELLRINLLNKRFPKQKDNVLNDISLNIYKGEAIGIVGESGCGKSTLARLVTRAIKPDSGSISYRKTDIFRIKSYPLRVQMIFQDPFLSLNPQMKVGDIVLEGVRILKLLSKKEAVHLVGTYLEMVGLERSLESRYPHQLSGGQRQRVSIARALMMNPELLICDEPTSCLDTVSQAQILELFRELRKEKGLAYMFISHDIRLLSNICDRIAVMYNGRIIETGRCMDILNSPAHPYTKTLVGAACSLEGIYFNCNE